MATIFGDTEGTLEARAKGQTLIGVDGEINYIYGDAYRIENMRGGNDVLTGGANSFVNLIYGDVFQMSKSQAGNDLLTGGASSSFNLLYGDAVLMSESQGGNDLITGGAYSSSNTLYGDAYQMLKSLGGNDFLTGGAHASSNIIYGDTYDMSGSKGGNDALTGGSNSYYIALYGDAFQMYNSQGGNDVLTGGSNSNFNLLYGDAFGMSDSYGGNDILVANDKPASGDFIPINTLFGDARNHEDGNAVCGNDHLISGTGNDDMWGDIAYSGNGNSPVDLTRVTTGQDVFVFSANNGNDTIHDFRQGEDKIELQGIGLASFDELMANTHLQPDVMNTVITFGSNTITVIGVTELTAADFLFT